MRVSFFLCVAFATIIIGSVQSAPCPTEICNFNNVVARYGPSDCCKYAYDGLGSICSYPVNPTPFTLEGTCEENGQTFKQLRPKDYFQAAPAAQANCRCKDAIPPASGFVSIGSSDIVGHDLPCDGSSFCKVCGPLSAVAKRCKPGHKGGLCTSFTYDGSCGYLKYGYKPRTYKTGLTTYMVPPPFPVDGFEGTNGRDIQGLLLEDTVAQALVGKDPGCEENPYCKECAGDFKTMLTDCCARFYKEHMRGLYL